MSTEQTTEDSALAVHHANVAAARAAAAARKTVSVPPLPSPHHGMDSAQFNDVLMTNDGLEFNADEDADAAEMEASEAQDNQGGDATANTKQSAKDGNNKSQSGGRRKAFTSEENLVLSRAWIEVSEDSTKSTNQTSLTFWASVEHKYQAMVAQANKINEHVDGYTPLQNRPEDSLRQAWAKRIQPAIQKFAGICCTNPPASGELEDDVKMNLYFNRMCKIYKERAPNWTSLPRNFDNLMTSFMFLRSHPKFATEFPTNGEKPPSAKKKLSKKASQAPGRMQRPVGRDAAKTTNSIDFVVHKVGERISKSLDAVAPVASTNNPDWSVITQSIVNGTNTMEALMKHQLMASAPSPVKKKYFDDIISANAMEATNKRQKAELDQQRMMIEKEKAAVELLELQSRKAALTNEANMSSIEPSGNPASQSNGTDKCSWPDCYGNSHPPEKCSWKGDDGSTCSGNLHHNCQIEYILRNGLPECNTKRCYNCWREKKY
jgi:hypothetical protein